LLLSLQDILLQVYASLGANLYNERFDFGF
jgi:hypothetical protein